MVKKRHFKIINDGVEYYI